jgi:hypothetical protein
VSNLQIAQFNGCLRERMLLGGASHVAPRAALPLNGALEAANECEPRAAAGTLSRDSERIFCVGTSRVLLSCRRRL